MIARLLILLLISGAAQAFASDLIYRSNGTTVSGRIVEADNQFVRIEVIFSADRAPGVISIPRQDVVRLVITADEKQQTIIKRAAPTDLRELLGLWNARKSLIALEGADSGEIGLAYANSLLNSEFANQHAESLALFTFLEANDPDEARVNRAKQGRLKALIKLDRADEAVKDAMALVSEAEDPSILIEAKYVLAGAARGQFDEIIEENPRWEEDIAVRPERNRLYHEIIDLYLFPFLFHGSEEEPSARGLVELADFLINTGDNTEARALLEDVLILYPETAFVEKVKALREKLPKPETEESDSNET